MAAGVNLSKTLAGGSEELFDACCSPCSMDERITKAEKYCIGCDIYFCGNCIKYHNRISSEHQIFDKSQVEAGSNKTALPSKRCLTHHGRFVDMYCADHDVVCCGACIAVKHRTCVKVDYLPDVAKGIKESQELQEVKSMLHTVQCELQGEETKRKDDLSSLENESENILTEINQHEEELISKIRAMAQTTRELLKAKLSEGRKTLEEDIKNICSLKTTISLNEENISIGNEVDVFANVKYGKTAVEDCNVLLKDLLERTNRKILRFVASDILKSDVNESECLGNVSILEEEKKEDSKIKPEVQETRSFSTKFKEEIKEEKLNVDVEGKHIKDPEMLQYTATFSGKYKVNKDNCAITATCVLDNKTLMLFDDTYFILKKMDMDDFMIIDQLKLQGLSYSICSVGSEEVAVALCNIKKIQLVSVGRTMTLTRSFSTDHYCRGVAFNEVSGELYVSNNSNKVNIYDKNGKLIKTYDKDREGRSMFSATCNVAWSENKAVLYVTDWRKGLIALGMSGDLLWTCSDTELKNAHGLCVLPNNVILVSGVNSHNVIQVDERGKKVGTFLDARDNLNKPWALACDINRSRLIVGHNSYEIHIYILAKK